MILCMLKFSTGSRKSRKSESQKSFADAEQRYEGILLTYKSEVTQFPNGFDQIGMHSCKSVPNLYPLHTLEIM